MVHVYWLEDHRSLSRRVQSIHAAMQIRGDVLCTSHFVLGELLVGPLRVGDVTATALIEQYFRSPAVTNLDLTSRAARIFAELRAHNGIKPVDALHLGVAAAAGVDVFLTNDHRLQKVIVPGISFIAAMDSPLF